MKKTLRLFLSVSILVFSACSIKEDREGCPCILTIDPTHTTIITDYLSIKGWTGNRSLFGNNIAVKDYPDGLKVKVPKGSVTYSACSQLNSSLTTGTVIQTPPGQQADSLYAYSTTVNTSGETAYDRVILHKQFMTLNISFGKIQGLESNITEVIIQADYNGMNTDGLTPVKGDFRCSAVEKNGMFSVRLTRQGEGQITMKAYSEGILVKSGDIGKELNDHGYFWSAEDLDDAWIDYDLGITEAQVGIEDWRDGTTYVKII